MYPSSISYFYFSVATQKTYVVSKDYYTMECQNIPLQSLYPMQNFFLFFYVKETYFFQPKSIFENFDTA